MCIHHEIDLTTADEFGERLLGMLNDAALALMVSVGHRVGLFDAMAELPPSSSAEIAAAAGLEERYVREWLGAMTVGRIVVRDPAADTWWLPPAHAASLTRANPAGNMAVFAQYIGLMGAVEDRIVNCFREGGGVPYSQFGRFQEVMAEDSGQSVVSSLHDAIVPLVEGLFRRLEEGIDALDIGCGRGLALLELARAYPRSRFTGYDISEEAIGYARRQAEAAGLDNVRFEVRDVSTPDGERSYDLVTAFDVIHDQRDPGAVLAAVRAALRPDGVFLMQDIAGSCEPVANLDHPLGPLLYAISTMHCMTVSLAQGGAGLGTMWGEETAVRMLEEAGFGDVAVNHLEHDVQNCYYVVWPQREADEAAA